MSSASKTFGRVSLAAGLAAFVAGCGLPVTYKVEQQNFDPSKLSYAAAQGALLTEVRGNPFNEPKAQVDQAITETMYDAHFGPKVPFVTERPQNYRSPYRVVLLFNPDERLTSDALCNGNPEPGKATSGSVKLAAAFCANDIHETSVWGSVDGVQSAQSPQFQSLVRDMTAQLFPRENPNLRDGNDGVIIIPGG